ncbi:MAG: NAD(P)/FAD-dependent oxidoreductase [Geminicoccaceae bacterium]
MTVPHIVVVGGGAGGLELVTTLARKMARKGRARVTLVERNRSHIWKPLLHEVAAGSLDSSLDEVGYASHAHRWGYSYYYGDVEDIDRETRELVLAPMVDEDGKEIMGRHRLAFDYLVMAVGSISNDFGTPGVREHCAMLDRRKEAEHFRRRMLYQCLRVSRQLTKDPSTDPAVRIAIVGGGATGVELAAELYNAADALKHYGLEEFDRQRMKVTLLEAGPRILPALPDDLAAAAHQELEKLGVRVMCATAVGEVTEAGMLAKSGELIEADLKVWAAGVCGPDFLERIGGLETTRNRQLVVRKTLQTTIDERIFAIGDCCSCPRGEGETPVPPRAQAAHQMATHVAANLQRLLDNEPLTDYAYKDHGSLVSMSRFSTVGSLMGNLVGGRMAIEGRLARLVYVSLYRMHLVAIHGFLRAGMMILVGHINQVVRPKLKLH